MKDQPEKPAGTSPRWRNAAVTLLGIVLSGIALWFALRDVVLATVWKTIQSGDTALLAGAFVVYLANIAVRALRWHMLLRPASDFPLRAAQALLVGLAVNNVLPARLGELFRIEYTYRLLGASRGYCAGSLLRERLFDLASLGAALAIALAFATLAPSERHLDHVETIIGSFAIVVFIVAAISAGILIWAARPTGRPAHHSLVQTHRQRPGHEFLAVVHREALAAATALRGIGPREFAVLGLVTAAIWSLEALTLFLVALSLEIALTGAGIALLLFISSLSTLIPSAPGYIGTYQLAFVIVLSFFGIGAEVAVAAATIQQVVNIGLVTLIGLLVLVLTRTRQGEHILSASKSLDRRESP